MTEKRHSHQAEGCSNPIAPPLPGLYPPQQEPYPPQQEPYPPSYTSISNIQFEKSPPYEANRRSGGNNQTSVTILQQPVRTVYVERPHNESGFGLGVFIFAGITLFMSLVCGCWFALPCSIMGVIFGAVSLSHSSSHNDASTSQTYGKVSIFCTVSAIVTMIISFLAIIIIVIFTRASIRQ